jgi:hypothetical protein
MKKVILDENIPQPFRYDLDMFEVYTVGYLGWAGIKNGELINKIDGDFDVFITEDQNLRYQQNLSQRKISIIEVQVTRLDLLRLIKDLVIEAVLQAKPGSYIQVV